MQFLNLSLKTPEANLALDEVLLDSAEEGESGELIRFWESPSWFVVLGYSNQTARETRLENCAADGLPILRRPSGGGTVLQGPGCLNYALILAISETGPLKSLTGTNAFILEKHRQALAPLVSGRMTVEGISDLALNGLKFSGNAQRRKKNFLLFHGTILYGFDTSKIEAYLAMPSREPDYRHHRAHRDFVTNISLSPDQIQSALAKAWQADEPLRGIPEDKLQTLIEERYSQKAWNFKF